MNKTQLPIGHLVFKSRITNARKRFMSSELGKTVSGLLNKKLGKRARLKLGSSEMDLNPFRPRSPRKTIF